MNCRIENVLTRVGWNPYTGGDEPLIKTNWAPPNGRPIVQNHNAHFKMCWSDQQNLFTAVKGKVDGIVQIISRNWLSLSMLSIIYYALPHGISPGLGPFVAGI